MFVNYSSSPKNDCSSTHHGRRKSKRKRNAIPILANLCARGYERDRWIYEIAKQSIPAPDLAFFLDVPVETAVARVRQRPEEKDRYIDMELQNKLWALRLEMPQTVWRRNGA